MKEEAVLERVLSEHAALRRRLEVVEKLARALRRDDIKVSGGLRSELELLRDELRSHLSWEQREVGARVSDDLPSRERVAADGEELARVCDEFASNAFANPMLAAVLMDLVGRLRDDVDREEAHLRTRASFPRPAQP